MPKKPDPVVLGNQEREFRYTLQERKDLEQRYGQGLHELMLDKVTPVRDGRFTGGGVWEIQIAFLTLGLRHYGKRVITEEKVEKWILEAINNGQSMQAALAAAVTAVYRSGVLGAVVAAASEEEEEEPTAGEPTPSGS